MNDVRASENKDESIESGQEAAELVRLAKCNGSRFIKTVLESMTSETKMTLPTGIRDDEYLHYYLGEKSKSAQCTKQNSELVTAKIPHSIASRRESSRPARENSPHDITLHIPTDPDRILECLTPINEPPPRSRKNKYTDSGLAQKRLVTITAESRIVLFWRLSTKRRNNMCT